MLRRQADALSDLSVALHYIFFRQQTLIIARTDPPGKTPAIADSLLPTILPILSSAAIQYRPQRPDEKRRPSSFSQKFNKKLYPHGLACIRDAPHKPVRCWNAIRREIHLCQVKIHVERSQSYAGPPNVVLSRTQLRNPIGSPTATPGENLNDADRAQIEGVPENQRLVSAAFALQQDTSERSASPDPLGQPARSPRLKRRPCSCANAPWPVPVPPARSAHATRYISNANTRSALSAVDGDEARDAQNAVTG